MSTFSATDAALAGFRIARERPRTVLIWAGALAVVTFLSALAMIPTMGPWLAEMRSFTPQPGDPTEALRRLGRMAPIFFWATVFSLVYYAVVYAAANRVVLRPEASRFAYLRLGWDELRQLGLMVLWGLILFAVYVALIVVLVMLGFGVALATHGRTSGGGAIGGLLAVIAVLACFGGAVFLWVRFSLCSAQTFATGKINLFGSWALTRGRFWPMLGTYLLSGVLGVLVYLLALILFVAGAAVLGGGLGAIGAVFRPDLSSMAAYFTPLQIAYLLFASVIGPLVWLIVLTPAPEIYSQIAGAAAEL